jgi:hypothetical protein
MTYRGALEEVVVALYGSVTWGKAECLSNRSVGFR